MAINSPAQGRRVNWSEVAEATEPEVVREAVARETAMWGTALLSLGVFQLVGGVWGLDPFWGVALILVAAASFFCHSGAMLPVYGVMMGWAMITNLFSGALLWTGLGLLQSYWAFCIFRDFRALRRTAARLEMDLGSKEGQPDRADRIFPYAGCALTALAWLAVGIGFAGLMVWSFVTEQTPSEDALGLALAAIVDLACLGLAVSLAAVLARHRLRGVSALGIIGSALMLVGWLAAALFVS